LANAVRICDARSGVITGQRSHGFLVGSAPRPWPQLLIPDNSPVSRLMAGPLQFGLQPEGVRAHRPARLVSRLLASVRSTHPCTTYPQVEGAAQEAKRLASSDKPKLFIWHQCACVAPTKGGRPWLNARSNHQKSKRKKGRQHAQRPRRPPEKRHPSITAVAFPR
jgi:hypothetical protein